MFELQFTLEIDYLHRMLYGASRAITERMVRGAEYMAVKKVYSINIVYFDLGQSDDYVYHGRTHFTGLHVKDELRLSQAQREVFGRERAGDIYPEYYILKINSFNGVAKDTLDEWIYFLKYNLIRDEFRAKGLDRACEVLDRDNLTPEERSMIASSKLEGRIEGREEHEKLAKELERERKEREKLAKENEILLAEMARLKT